MKCGVLSFLRQISVGFGWRWIIRPAKYWPIHLANARMKSSEPFRNCWSRSQSPCFLRMTGEAMPAISRRIPISSARIIHKLLSVRISLYVPISKDCAAKPFVFLNPLRCTTLSSDWSSTSGNLASSIPLTTGLVHDLKFYQNECHQAYITPL